MTIFPFILILGYILPAFLLPLMKNTKRAYQFQIGLGTVLSGVAIAQLCQVINNKPFIAVAGHFPAPWGIELSIGGMEATIAVLFTIASTLTVAYSERSVMEEIKPERERLFLSIVNLLIGSLLGIVFTADLFNGFVFLEVSTLAACGLIVVKDKPSCMKAAIKYLILSSLGSGLVLMGIAYLYAMTGQLNMAFVREALDPAAYPNMIRISTVLFLTGLGLKAAMFPLHVWLPDAHTSAPGPSSALLSGLVIKAPAIFLIKIVTDVYGLEALKGMEFLPVALILGSAGMILGSIFARSQRDVKRMIAYSSVAQMGYVFLAIGLGTELALAVAVYHMLGHGFTKTALFLAAAAFIEQTGSREIESFKGMGKHLKVTLTIFTISGLSMVGIPILPGFISKWQLALATINSGPILLLGIILISSLLNATYYFPIIINGWFAEADGSVSLQYTKKLPSLVPLLLLGVAIALTGFFSGPLIEWIQIGLLP